MGLNFTSIHLVSGTYREFYAFTGKRCEQKVQEFYENGYFLMESSGTSWQYLSCISPDRLKVFLRRSPGKVEQL